MDNNEFQNLCIEQFKTINKRFDSIDKRFVDIDKRFDGIDKRFVDIDKRFDSIDKRFNGIDNELHKIKTQSDERFALLDERTRETNDIVRALRENSEYVNAKLEALETSTASAASVKRVDAKLNVLNERLFEQETQLRLVK